jgi:hypothetical protein
VVKFIRCLTAKKGWIRGVDIDGYFVAVVRGNRIIVTLVNAPLETANPGRFHSEPDGIGWFIDQRQCVLWIFCTCGVGLTPS